MRRIYRVAEMIISLTILLSMDYPIATGQSNPKPNQSSQSQTNKSRNVKQFKFGNTIYRIKNDRTAHHNLTNSQIQLDLKQLKDQTVYDVKKERANYFSGSIQVNHKLNRLANLRAKQVANHFSHYNKNHQPMTKIDAPKVGLPTHFQASENIASTSLGKCTIITDPKTYDNHNGRDMANMSNDGMMNYDEFEQNGHRKNILSNDNTLIGVGVAYSARKHTFYLAEDFGNENPRSSANVNRQDLKLHFHFYHRSSWTLFWNWSTMVVKRITSRIIHWITDKI